ncbi:ribonuclease III [Desulfoferrobacter suflitae]|uniref:ribonuclease III n=1 Tax=Desulfoferrobacter suflitae TaxID=2865782 RepID=UPI002164E921|nr:ribonuclease III [Desulfoferrobacter suflitae]MCK8603097.1 ribonuclease III [Desulfoferrobacter suflitae]
MNQASALDAIEKVLQYRFREPRLLYQALVHRSFVYENPAPGQVDNETLEFLGDAVLNLAISHLLLEKFPDYNEGELSRLRSSIVNERELAKLAVQLELGKYLFLGKGEEFTGGRQKPSLLADSLEALLAAIYLDSDLTTVIHLVQRLFQEYLDIKDQEHPLKALDKDYKTQLQELTQAFFKQTPTYLLESEEGPDHDKTFFMSVWLEERLLARGFGKSKKEAQQLAAMGALEKLREEKYETVD